MLIITLLFLATASALYLMLRSRDAHWQAWLTLAIVAVVAWMCSVGTFALALDSKAITGTDDISLMSKILVAGFLLYPLILWMIARSFERGRNA